MQHLLGFLMAMADVGTRRVFERHVGEPFELREVEFTLLVLLHKGRGGGLSDLFGGGVSSSLGGSSVAERNLDRITIGVGLVWFAAIVALGLLYKLG